MTLTLPHTRPLNPEWAVAVTTAPRRTPTLRRCVESLGSAGFAEPWVFAEPGSPQLDELAAGAVVVSRSEPTGGAFPNFYLACWELLTRFPHATRYLLVQDDALFAPGDWAKEVAALPCWTQPHFGMLTLFASSKYDRFRSGSRWFTFPHGERWLYSAQAMAFSRDSLLHFCTNEPAKLHAREPARKRQRYVDALVGNWAKKHDKSVLLPAISVVKHIGDDSTLWEENPPCTGWRNCSTWAGDVVDQTIPAAELSVCVALCNRGPALARMLATLTRSWASCQQPLIRLRVADFASDDIDLRSVLASLPFAAEVITLGRPFNRSRGLNAAAAAADVDGIIAFLDADMDLPATFFRDALRNVAEGVAWAPVCYSLHEHAPPEIAGDGKPPANGWWRHTGWGNLIVNAGDFAETGGFDEDTGRTWGREDEFLRDRLRANEVRLIRENYPGFFHRWHHTDLRHAYHDKNAPLAAIGGHP